MEELEVPQPEQTPEVTEQLELSEDPAQLAQLQAMLEAIVYITDEPLTMQQIASALAQPIDKVKKLLDALVAEFDKPEHGLSIREVAGGYKKGTKKENHRAARAVAQKKTPPPKI